VSRPAKIYSFHTLDDFSPPISFRRPVIIISLNPERFTGVDPDIVNKVRQRYPQVRLFEGMKIPGHVPWVLAIEVEKN